MEHGSRVWHHFVISFLLPATWLRLQCATLTTRLHTPTTSVTNDQQERRTLWRAFLAPSRTPRKRSHHLSSPVLRHDDACHTLPELKARSSLGQILFGTWPFMLQLRWSKAKDDNIAPDDFGSPPDTLAVPGAFKLAHSSCQTPLERPS
ncbi:hypothetical protein BDZ89DRAFT_273740 [Hymenopellis radicata]|nr:hypothetical protein BDZ89DRAFT_273740 [Hymenopellis radicata]